MCHEGMRTDSGVVDSYVHPCRDRNQFGEIHVRFFVPGIMEDLSFFHLNWYSGARMEYVLSFGAYCFRGTDPNQSFRIAERGRGLITTSCCRLSFVYLFIFLIW